MRFWLDIAACLLLGIVLGSSWLSSSVQAISPVSLGSVPWPMFRHDLLHTGRSPYLGAQTFHLKWSFDVGGNGLDSTPAIDSNGNVYVQSRGEYLFALYPDGTLKWKFSTSNGIAGCCSGPESSPAIDSKSVIYVGSSDGNLYSIFSNGTLNWRFATGAAIQSSPAIGIDGTIYFGSDDGYLYAISQSGGLKWKFATGGAVVSSPTVDLFGGSSGGTIYVG